ncbi:MAG: hypothetical protein GX224_05735 [Thermoplasmatales archaeon]|nr:hypothetical protein [Thermoplasmatales archaeon]
MKTCPGGSCGLSCSDGTCGGTCPDGTDEVRLPPGMLSVYDIDQEIADGAMVFIDNFGDERDVAGLVEAISDHPGQVFGVVFGGLDLKSEYPRYISMGLDTLYHVRNPRLTEYNPEGCAGAIAELWERVRPASIFFNSSGVGRELAAMVAGKLASGIADGASSARFRGRDVSVRVGTDEISFRGYPQIVVWDDSTLPNPAPSGSKKGTTVNRPYSHPSEIVPLEASDAGGCVFVGEGCDGRAVLLARDFAEEAGVGLHEPGKLYGRCVLVCPSEAEYLSVMAARKICLFDGEPGFRVGRSDSAGRLSDLSG